MIPAVGMIAGGRGGGGVLCSAAAGGAGLLDLDDGRVQVTAEEPEVGRPEAGHVLEVVQTGDDDLGHRADTQRAGHRLEGGGAVATDVGEHAGEVVALAVDVGDDLLLPPLRLIVGHSRGNRDVSERSWPSHEAHLPCGTGATSSWLQRQYPLHSP